MDFATTSSVTPYSKSIYVKDSKTLNALLKAAEQWKSFDHPNTLKLKFFNIFKEDESTTRVDYSFEETMCPLRDMITQRGALGNYLTKEEFIIASLQLISGLTYLHRHDVAHGNLSTQNVLITSDDLFKITEASKLLKLDGESPTYYTNCPERARIGDLADSKQIMRMDIWALGMLLIELGNLCEITEVKSEHIRLIEEKYEKKVAKIIHQMIEADPERRFSLKKISDDFKKIAKQLGINEDAYNTKTKPTPTVNPTGEEEKADSFKKKKEPRKHPEFTVIPLSEIQKFYNDEGKLGSGKIPESNIKISTWNLNSIINVLNNFDTIPRYITRENPDFLCLTETHLKYEDLVQEPMKNFQPTDYIAFHNCHKGNIGRSGVSILTKYKPISVLYDLGIEEHDKEGRVITLEYEKFYLVNCYTPNSGRSLQRLEYRTTKWDPDFKNFIVELSKKKHVVLCGDLNVAHKTIDVHAPKRYAGFTEEERNKFSVLLKSGFVDTFRYLYPHEKQYTFFSSHFDAREQHKGWRLDYFVVDREALKGVKDVKIQKEVLGSDHCPMEMTFDLAQV